MKKIGVYAILFLLLLSIAQLSIAEDATSTDGDSYSDKIENGFTCLEEKAIDCSTLTTQDIALTILATPDNIFDSCVTELESKKTLNHWGSVRNTAIAILALKHAGKDTKLSEDWLLEQERIPTELIWYIQQDSDIETRCNIIYDSRDHRITIGENKKIDSNAGPCLDLARDDFWLKIDSDCYDEEFSIECDQDFIANLLYKDKHSPTLYILEGTGSASASSSIELKIKSKCFGSNSCDYEATAWATLALSKTGHNVEEFIYMLTSYDDYATQLITNQDQVRSYWDVSDSKYTRFYDTALALIAMGSSSAVQVTDAKNQLLLDQGSNGCWQDSVQDTAIVLWALEGRAGRASADSDSTTGGVTLCSEVDYFCIPSYDCPDSEKAIKYFCSVSEVCCIKENLKTCSDYYGKECDTNENCIGNKRKATDTDNCCTGTCKEKSDETECEENFYSCMDTCSDYQEPIPAYSCDNSQICCKMKDATEDEESTWWIWILVVLILAILGAIGYIYREKLKLAWFKIKNKSKKGKGKGGIPPRGPRPGMPPPRPGFPPIRRPRPPVAQIRRQPTRQDNAMNETFRRLKEMSS